MPLSLDALVQPRQSHTDIEFVGVGPTMPEQHSVGCLTFVMTPSAPFYPASAARS